MENYEQKYKNALKWAQDCIKAGASGMLKEDLEHYFPELTESEDEKIRKGIIRYIKKTSPAMGENIENMVAWLEKQGEKKPAWSEEDESALGDALWAIKQARSIAKDENDMGNLWYAENWLKSLKDRVQLQPKQEWSEEDEKKIMWIVRLISTAGFRELDNDKMPCSRSELLYWLKSIKPNHWKPSEEQMEALQYATGNGGTYNKEALNRLYNDLKTL